MIKHDMVDRIGWIVLIGIALGISNWSVTHLTADVGVPLAPALAFSAVFDLGAIQFARRGLRYLLGARPVKAIGPRIGVLLMVCTSAALGFANGLSMGDGAVRYVIAVALGAVPICAAVQYESELKFRFRDARERSGLTLPHLDPLTWLFFPRDAVRTLKAIVRQRLALLVELPPSDLPKVRAQAYRVEIGAPRPDDTAPLPRIVDDYLPPLEPPALAELPKADAVRHVLAHRPGATATQIVALLAAHGVDVQAAYVRKVRSTDRRTDDDKVLHLAT